MTGPTREREWNWSTYSGGPVWNWFSLSYAQYLTVPRSVLCSMPEDWQQRFVDLMDDLDEEIDWRPKDGQYWVELRSRNGRYARDPLMEYRRPDRDHINSLRRPAMLTAREEGVADG